MAAAVARTQYTMTAMDAEVIKWQASMAASVAIDLTTPVAEGAAVDNLAAQLWRFPDLSEPRNIMIAPADGETVGTPVANGSVVSVPVSALVKGRIYRLELSYGAVGNKRTSSVIIAVGW